MSIKGLPWVEAVNSHGVERVAKAMGLVMAGRLSCAYCGAWAAIREDGRIWNCSSCETTGTPFTLAAARYWKESNIEAPTEADWEALWRLLRALQLC